MRQRSRDRHHKIEIVDEADRIYSVPVSVGVVNITRNKQSREIPNEEVLLIL